MAAEQGEGGADLVLLLVKPLQVAGEEEGERRGEPYGGRQWTIRPHYPIMPASYAHY